MSRGARKAAGSDGALQLAGELAITPLPEVLRLLAASHATGVLVVHDRRDPAAEVVLRIWLRRGEILLCATTAVGELEPSLSPELRERVMRNAALGKPMQVTLAEAGAMRAANLPFELRAASARLIGGAFDARAGRFAWEPMATLPEFVESFGRHVALTSLAPEGAPARRTVAVLDADREGVIAALRAWLTQRSPPIDVVELDPARPVAAAAIEAGAELVWLGVAAVTRHVLEQELPALARGGAAVICVLDAPNPALSSQMLQAGLTAVLTKPVHTGEIERLLSATATAQEAMCPPFSS